VTTEEQAKPTWRDTLAAFRERPVITIFLLGYAAGVPLMIVLSTSGFWLREIGVSRTAIGFLVWASFPWALKVFWSPLVDRMPLPWLTPALGKRRSYILLSQFGVICGLVGIAILNPQATFDSGGNATSTAARMAGLTADAEGVWPVLGGLMNVGLTPPETDVIIMMALLMFFVAFASATQDIAVDAFRIESAPERLLGPMAAAYQYGYRVAVLVAGAGALYIADFWDYATAYLVMAATMIIGIITILFATEPVHKVSKDVRDREAALAAQFATAGHLHGRFKRATQWGSAAVASPLVDFFARNGWMALAILALIGMFRLSDLTLGAMANPFYVDMGFSKSEVASIAKGFGLVMTLFGVGIGGTMIVRFGIMPMLLISAILLTITNLLFAVMAIVGHELWMLAITISADNLAGGMSGSVFIAYLSALTNRAYTATQYALFTSLMSLFGKFLAGFSGVVVDATDYVAFFIYASILGIPSILLIIFIRIRGREGMPGYERPATGPMVL
jgi:MFS transporter, PAT family, beta-lactamase induction signal transducer AmpG